MDIFPPPIDVTSKRRSAGIASYDFETNAKKVNILKLHKRLRNVVPLMNVGDVDNTPVCSCEIFMQ